MSITCHMERLPSSPPEIRSFPVKTLGVILELLQSDTTEEEMIRKLTERFNVTEETASRDVKRVLSELRKIGAIDE